MLWLCHLNLDNKSVYNKTTELYDETKNTIETPEQMRVLGDQDSLPDRALRPAWVVDLKAAESLSGKGSDPLRRSKETSNIDSPPQGQTPFRTDSDFE